MIYGALPMEAHDKEEKLLFTEDEWNQAVPKVVAAMTKHLQPYRTPVFKHCDDHGTGWGSGSYISLGSRVFILTNEHVAEARRQSQILTHKFVDDEIIRPIAGNHSEMPWPYDLALLPVKDDDWASEHGSRAIGLERMGFAHTPVPGELFTFSGFSGQQTAFHFDTLFAKATCSTAREVALPPDDRFNNRFHFGLDYRPDLATNVLSDDPLPLPPGFSGSTVWNTRFVEAKMSGSAWTPDLALVTGVVWGWPSSVGCLVATRVEYIRSFLLEVIGNQSL